MGLINKAEDHTHSSACVYEFQGSFCNIKYMEFDDTIGDIDG
jgi:hypothetical protein